LLSLMYMLIQMIIYSIVDKYFKVQVQDKIIKPGFYS